jgi:hypothetical protein
MATDEDYDLVPHSELRKIQGEINELRGGSSKGPSTGLQKTMDDLSGSLKSMISIFSEAKNELRIEDQEKELFSSKIDPILQKLDSLLGQNEKIAEAILSIAEMVQKLEGKVDSIENHSKESNSRESRIDLSEKDVSSRNSPGSTDVFPNNPNTQSFQGQSSQNQYSQGLNFQSQNPQGSLSGFQSNNPSNRMQSGLSNMGSGQSSFMSAQPNPIPPNPLQSNPGQSNSNTTDQFQPNQSQQFGQSSGFQPPQQQFNQSSSPQEDQAFNDDLFSSPGSSDLKKPTLEDNLDQQRVGKSNGMNMPPPPPPANKKKSFFSK